MNNEFETLQNIFSYSSRYVFILNYDFEVLWKNKNDAQDLFAKADFSELLSGYNTPLKGGEYTLTYAGLEYSAEIINYPDSELYIVQMSGEDVMSGLVKHDSVRNYLSNQEAQIREAIAGITCVGDMLKRTLDETGLKDGEHYVDVATGNCYKLLRAITGTNELIKYSEAENSPTGIELISILEDFTETCKKIVKNGVNFILNAPACKVYIMTDYDRLNTCLLELILLTCRNNARTKSVTISVKCIKDSVSITFYSDKLKKEPVRTMFSKFEKLYKSEVSDPDHVIVNKFCLQFGADLFVADVAEDNCKSYSLRLPTCEGGIIMKSPKEKIAYDKFSKYHIALSEIIELK